MSGKLGKHGEIEQRKSEHPSLWNTYASHEKSKSYAKFVQVLDPHIGRCMIEKAARRGRLRKAVVEDNYDEQEGGYDPKNRCV